ncbi:MAG: DUF115 domain-containing protein [Desulfarculus sp.]|nr:DUF115 domain-containing protein [Desulfarculus sp.]
MPFSLDCLRQNFAVLASVSPEVACWLEAEADFAHCHQRAANLTPSPPHNNPLLERGLEVGGITVVVGGGLLDEVCQLIKCMPPGHQVFLLEPRAEVLALGLGRFAVEPHLAEGDLVLLAPSEAALEEALQRHPQLALAERLELITMASRDGRPLPEAARARLYRVLGQAVKARDMALNWEGPAGANLVRNLCHLAFMGRSLEMAGSLAGKPALLVEQGPSLGESLERLTGLVGGAALFCTDAALPTVLEAGILPTAVALTNPGQGPLWGFQHQALAATPLVAEEVAHASTVKAYPGPRFLCLGPRVTLPGHFSLLAPSFTPQHHCLARLAEVAALAGCQPLILVGADLCQEGGELNLPGMDGQPVVSSLEQAAAANGLGRVLARLGQGAINTSPRGLGLPGTRPGSLEDLLPILGGPGQPPRAAGLDQEAWLDAAGLAEVAQGLRLAAAGATRLWQRAAAPLLDFPRGQGQQAAALLTSADHLFVALAEQAAAEPLLSAFMGGCLVRAFRRRHRLLCNGRSQGITVDDACQELQRCLQDMESRAGELAVAMRQMADEFEELSQASRAGDREFLSSYARQTGHPALA